MGRVRLTDLRMVLPVTLAIAACRPGDDPARQPPPVDTAVVVPADTAPPSLNWTPVVGSAILVPSAEGDPVIAATGVAAGTLRGARVHLLGRGGLADTATVAEVIDAGEGWCANLPHARLAASRGTLIPWRVGLVSADAVGLAADSISGIGTRDSAMVAAAILRAASRLGTGDARFEGLPYGIHSAWRVTLPGGERIQVAQLVRRIAMEASPLEERSFLVLEQEPGESRNLSVVYSEISGGSELTVEGIDLLAIARLASAPGITLIVAREGESGTAFSLIERTGPRRWRLRWTSDRTHCE